MTFLVHEITVFQQFEANKSPYLIQKIYDEVSEEVAFHAVFKELAELSE